MDLLAELEASLRERRRVIADHDWRDRDPEAHLAALRGVSEKIAAVTERLGPVASPRLRHFLDNCSYDKALAFLAEAGPPSGRV